MNTYLQKNKIEAMYPELEYNDIEAISQAFSCSYNEDLLPKDWTDMSYLQAEAESSVNQLLLYIEKQKLSKILQDLIEDKMPELRDLLSYDCQFDWKNDNKEIQEYKLLLNTMFTYLSNIEGEFTPSYYYPPPTPPKYT